MTSRVFLHVGAPKTGTTYLQDRLALNAKSLADNGVHFPSRAPMVSPGLFHFRAALDLLGQDWGGPAGHAEGNWDALVRRVRRKNGSVVISHEILAPAPAEAIARAKRDLADSELHIVYTARDLARQIPASWQESVKQGRKWSYRSYLDRLEHGRPWFYRALDLPSVLTSWGAGLPPERDPRRHGAAERLGRGACCGRASAQVVGIDPAWAPRESNRLNQSLGVAETQVIRKLNRRMKRATRREASFDELIREMLAQNSLVQGRSTPVRLPERMYPWAEAETESWVEWLKGSGVHVVGDIDDLRPLPLRPDERYVDPDRVSTKRQLKVALDALSAMTREAARRPDPDQQLIAKVRRQTTRRRHAVRPVTRQRASGSRGAGWPTSATAVRRPGATGGSTCAPPTPRPASTGSHGRYLPGAQQLELLRRLNLAGRPTAALAERVLEASAPGRGTPDLELVGAAEESAVRAAADRAARPARLRADPGRHRPDRRGRGGRRAAARAGCPAPCGRGAAATGWSATRGSPTPCAPS